MITRRSFIASAAGLAATGLSGGAYAFYGEPRLRLVVTRYALTPPGWPAELKLTAAVLADIHAGEASMPLARVERVVETTNALAPDIVFLLGDYANGNFRRGTTLPWGRIAHALAALRAPLGVHAIAGNHEWWPDGPAQRRKAGPTEAHAAFAAAGLPFLENTGRRLVHRGAPFWVLGLGDQIAFVLGGRRYRGVDDLPATLRARTDDAPAILLAHEPDIFPHVPNSISLVLSGHTHGGQVRLFGYSPVVPSAYGNRYAYGHVVEDDRHLIVSGGLGTVSAGLAPVRFGVPPEIVLVDLGGQAPAV